MISTLYYILTVIVAVGALFGMMIYGFTAVNTESKSIAVLGFVVETAIFLAFALPIILL